MRFIPKEFTRAHMCVLVVFVDSTRLLDSKLSHLFKQSSSMALCLTTTHRW